VHSGNGEFDIKKSLAHRSFFSLVMSKNEIEKQVPDHRQIVPGQLGFFFPNGRNNEDLSYGVWQDTPLKRTFRNSPSLAQK
jgi:hypothetical protein